MKISLPLAENEDFDCKNLGDVVFVWEVKGNKFSGLSVTSAGNYCSRYQFLFLPTAVRGMENCPDFIAFSTHSGNLLHQDYQMNSASEMYPILYPTNSGTSLSKWEILIRAIPQPTVYDLLLFPAYTFSDLELIYSNLKN